MRLEHHLIELAVLAQVVALRLGQVDAPVGQQRLHAVDDRIVGERDGRHAHHAAEVADGGDAVGKRRELAVVVREGLVFQVLEV
jgi:hypothetical protein